MKYTQYTLIVEGDDEDVFVAQINEKIQQGWQPIGGVAASNGFLLQAMGLPEQTTLITEVGNDLHASQLAASSHH